MPQASIHQAIHGYCDGHRLLSCSTPLSADSARAMLVLSDMSGPSMQSGFDEYLTGYPLPGSEYFVLAKTWYASEMQRPGCVWTHSLLIPRAQVSNVTTACLLGHFNRPQLNGVEQAAAAQIVINDKNDENLRVAGFGDRVLATALVGAVFGQSRPVIVTVDTAAQLEEVVLWLWDGLWPAEKARFSFCTGALMPRTNAGALMDLQAVPRAVPPSQFRKSASAALVLDLRAPIRSEAWIDLVIDSATHNDAAFQTWLEAARLDIDRSNVPNLAHIYNEWYALNSSARSIIMSIVNAKGLDPNVRDRLIEMVFDRDGTETGTTRRELLQYLCGDLGIDLMPVAHILENQVLRLFKESRADGITLVLSLLGSELTEVGESVLRATVLQLVSSDLEMFGDAQATFLPTIVGANSRLACSPLLWRRVGARSGEVLAHLGKSNLSDEERGAVIDAIFASGLDISVDGLVRFGGKIAIFRGLSAMVNGQIQLSWSWRAALSTQSDAVLEWFENLTTPSLRHLELGSRFLSPNATQARLAKVWKAGTAGALQLVPRVAAFGLALAFWESLSDSPLLAACFQPTYDAAGISRLEYDEWDWLREYAPSVYWYHDWDRCERLAAAVARLFEKQATSLEVVFQVVQSRNAIRKVSTILYDDHDTRPYLKSLRKKAESSTIGTHEQRNALLED